MKEPSSSPQVLRLIDMIEERDAASEQKLVTLHGPELAEELPELEYLVKELGLVAGNGAINLVAGAGFSGKTMAMQSLLLSLVSGKAVWGAYPCRERRVAHVDLEQGIRTTKRRYQRLALGMGIDLRALGDSIAVHIFPPLALKTECESGWKRVMDGRDVLVVDSLSAASGGTDENTTAMRHGMDMLSRIAETTACKSILLHHVRKPGLEETPGQASIRGSSAIFNAVDSAFIFSAKEREPTQVTHVKAREHGELVEDFALTITNVASGDNPRAGLRVQVCGKELLVERKEAHEKTSNAARIEHDVRAVRECIAASPGISTPEIRMRVQISQVRLSAALATLGPAIKKTFVEGDNWGRYTLVGN